MLLKSNIDEFSSINITPKQSNTKQTYTYTDTRTNTELPITRKIDNINGVKANVHKPSIDDYKDGGKSLAQEDEESTYQTSELITACVDYIARILSQVRLRPMEMKKGSLHSYNLSDELQSTLLQPNPYQTWTEVMQLMVQSYYLGGNAYLAEDTDGLWVLNPPSEVVAVPDKKSYIKQYIFKEVIKFASEQVIHWRRPILANDYYGVSIIPSILDSLEIEAAAMNDLKNYYSNSSAYSDGYWSSDRPLTDNQRVQIEREISLGGRGDSKFTTKLVSAGLKFNPVRLSPRESQLLDSLPITEDKVLMTFNLHKHLLGGVLPSYPVAPSELQKLQFTQVIRPLGLSFAEVFSKYIRVKEGNPNIIVVADYTHLPEMADANKPLAEYVKTAVESGTMTVNEARAKLGLVAMDEEAADTLFISANLRGSYPIPLRNALDEEFLHTINGITDSDT